MKKAIIILLSAVLVFAVVSCRSSVARDVDEDNGMKGSYHNYEYSIGTDGLEMNFVIEGNPTTGFQWTLLTNDDSFETVSSDYLPNSNPEMMVGVGGHYKFVIDFKTAGEHQLDFAYMRPWDPKDSPLYLSMKVTVKGNAITDVSIVE